MIFFFSFGGGQANFGAAPLMFLMPLILSSGVLSWVVDQTLLVFSWLSGGDVTFVREGYAAPPHRAAPPPAPAAAEGDLRVQQEEAMRAAWFQMGVSLLSIAAIMFASLVVPSLWANARRIGWWPALQAWFAEGFNWMGPRGRQQAPAPGKKERLAKVQKALESMLLEEYETEEQLRESSIGHLKERLAKVNVDCSRCVEKSELISKLMEVGGSSADGCPICCEDYVEGDVLRVLRCGHRYHVECVDRWLLSATDYSKPPSCPMCNADICARAG